MVPGRGVLMVVVGLLNLLNALTDAAPGLRFVCIAPTSLISIYSIAGGILVVRAWSHVLVLESWFH